MKLARRADPPLRLRGIAYDTYLRIRRSNPGFRMTYWDGDLEIMSPLYRHERAAYRIGEVVRAVARARDIPFLVAGSTTFRLGDRPLPRGGGKEPDASFYFANLGRVLGKATIALPADPPPDLWIEVGHRGSSRGRLPLYARLGVPEVWRLRLERGTLWFGRLEGESYEEIDRSLSLPMLTPGLVMHALDRGRDLDDNAWGRWLEAWAATPEGA